MVANPIPSRRAANDWSPNQLAKREAIIKATARLMVCLTQGLRVVGKSGRALPEPSTVVGIALKLLG